MSKTLPNNAAITDGCEKEPGVRGGDVVDTTLFMNMIVVGEKGKKIGDTQEKKCENVRTCSNRTKKPKRPRCAIDGCKKRLRITDVKCRCENMYCKKHRLPETHECTFDYKGFWSDKIQGLGGGKFKKLNKL